jgi:hypothetical protein
VHFHDLDNRFAGRLQVFSLVFTHGDLFMLY